MMRLIRFRLLPALLVLAVALTQHQLSSAATKAASSDESPCLLVPAVQKLRLLAARTQSTNNLKQIALALHSHHDAYRTLPGAAICDPNGKPLLSWRVAILPFVEELQLYEQFKKDEPWDSEHNKKLIPRMPKIYVVSAAPSVPGETYYRVFVGGGAAFDLTKGIGLAQITDGTSNTLMCFEASRSVTWTKPDDLIYDDKKPLPKPADFYGSRSFLAAFCDGSVRSIRNSVSEATMRALITRAAGDVPGQDWD